LDAMPRLSRHRVLSRLARPTRPSPEGEMTVNWNGDDTEREIIVKLREAQVEFLKNSEATREGSAWRAGAEGENEMIPSHI
jgi:hypothetical protein